MASYQGISFPFRYGGSGRVVLSTDEDHIRESIFQILMTQPGERVMEPEFGCDLKSLLFEPFSTSLASLAEARVRMALARWEPRIEVKQVTLRPSPDGEGHLILEVEYEIIRLQAEDSIVLRLGGE